MTKKPLRHTNRNLFHSSNRHYEGAAITSISTAWMVDEFLVEPRDLEYLQYEENTVAKFGELTKSQELNEGVSMDYARSEGVNNEWESYHFFAQDEVNAPDEVFVYVTDDGEVAYLTSDQQQAIQEWIPGTPIPIPGMEGHHLETVKENPSDTNLAADPDNILLATADGHRMHLHDGNTQNPTAEAYIGIDTSNEEKLTMTLSHNEEHITINFWEAGGLAVAGSAALYITASSIIELMKLRRDPRPWIEKRRDLAMNGFMSGLIGAGIGGISYSSHLAIDSLIGEFSVGGLEVFFNEMLAINGAFFAVSVVTAGYTYMKLRKQGQTQEQALRQFKSSIRSSTAELLAFSALGIGIEIGMDTLGGLAMDALIPDPTGILIALRLSYSILKIGSKVKRSKLEKAASHDCIKIREKFYYEQAKLSIE